MHRRLISLFALSALGVAVAVGPARSDEPKNPRSPEATTTPQQVRKAAERGLTFLREDAEKWRAEHNCSTCHHGTLTLWAFAEAKSQGYAVDSEKLAELTRWTKERLADVHKPRDKRPGWNMVSSPAVYLAIMAQAVPQQTAISAEDLLRIDDHLVRHQEADGSWAWSLAPAGNRPPPFFESDEVVTMLASAAVRKYEPADAKAKTLARESLEKASAWLEKKESTNTTQWVAFQLLVDVLAGKPALQKKVDALLERQNKDGGWAQLKELGSDAYATGQALYVLSLAGVKSDRAEIQRGVAFLLSTQKENGSWPMISRAHPGAKPAKNLQPITHFGSAWATLALLRMAQVK